MSYLQKAWTDPISNPTLTDIQSAVSEIQNVDYEHGAFWVGTDEEDIVLEIQKDLRMTLVLCGEICRESKCNNWTQATELYQYLINGEYDKLKDQFECIWNKQIFCKRFKSYRTAVAFW